jgi:glycosyltransferase involved in cell wall biosynthesis
MASKSNILIVYHYLIPWGGVEKHILELTDFLQFRLKMKTYILSLYPDETLDEIMPPEGYKKLPYEKIYKEYVNLSKKYNIILLKIPSTLLKIKYLRNIVTIIIIFILYRKILSIIKENNINIIYSCEPISIIATYLFSILHRRLRRQIRLVASIHSSWAFKSDVRKAIARHLLKNYDAIVVPTIDTTTFKRLYELLPSRVYFVPNWIDTNRFRPSELRNDSSKIVLLYNARFVEIKNPFAVVMAFLFLKNKIPGLKLIMIGEGRLKDVILRLIRKLNIENDVVLLNSIPSYSDIYPQIYTSADIFVLVPFHTGFSITALEALASGLPVIYSDVDGIPPDLRRYIISVKGYNNTDELIRAIKFVVDNLYHYKLYARDAILYIKNRYEKYRVLSRLAQIIIGIRDK